VVRALPKPAYGPAGTSHEWLSLAAPVLVLWAAALVALAVRDVRSRSVPTRWARAAMLATASGVATAGALSGDWRPALSGALSWAVAAVSYGTWGLARPNRIGFGDVRVACLVALGEGVVSPPATLVSLACAPLVAGLVGRRRDGPVAVPLVPFLALAGVAGLAGAMAVAN
jgi:prepilin signal peptidase PulO-like enzyme (type II secretory pathway)